MLCFAEVFEHLAVADLYILQTFSGIRVSGPVKAVICSSSVACRHKGAQSVLSNACNVLAGLIVGASLQFHGVESHSLRSCNVLEKLVSNCTLFHSVTNLSVSCVLAIVWRYVARVLLYQGR